MTGMFRHSLRSSLHGPVGSTSASWAQGAGGIGERDRVEARTQGWQGVDTPKWNGKDVAGVPRGLGMVGSALDLEWETQVQNPLSILHSPFFLIFQMGIPTPRDCL